MKLQKIILSAAAAFAAFGASVGTLEIGRWLMPAFEPLKIDFKLPEITAAPVVYPMRPIPGFQQPEYEPPASSSSEEVCEFDETGDYSFLDDNPKGFEDFQSMSIVTRVYSEKYPNGIAVKPQGSLQTSKMEFKFVRINITGRRISFVTESRKGIRYQFDGKFTDEVRPTEEESDFPELKGRLTKWRGVNRIAEAKADFGEICGC